MKKSFTAFACLAAAVAASPAVAGPNWDVIHQAEANALHKHEGTAAGMPLDHGPRALSTPWLNEERVESAVHSGKNGAQLSAHTHHNQAHS